MAEQRVWGQVNWKLTGQVHPGNHHQLSQLGGCGGGFTLKTLGGIESCVSQADTSFLDVAVLVLYS